MAFRGVHTHTLRQEWRLGDSIFTRSGQKCGKVLTVPGLHITPYFSNESKSFCEPWGRWRRAHPHRWWWFCRTQLRVDLQHSMSIFFESSVQDWWLPSVAKKKNFHFCWLRNGMNLAESGRWIAIRHLHCKRPRSNLPSTFRVVYCCAKKSILRVFGFLKCPRYYTVDGIPWRCCSEFPSRDEVRKSKSLLL